MLESALSCRRRRLIQQPTASSSCSYAATPLSSSALAAAPETHMRRPLSEDGAPTLGPAWTTFSFRLHSTTASPAAQWTPAAKNLTTSPYGPSFSFSRSPELNPPPSPVAALAFPAYSGSPAAKQPMPPLYKQTPGVPIVRCSHRSRRSYCSISTFIEDVKPQPTRVIMRPSCHDVMTLRIESGSHEQTQRL